MQRKAAIFFHFLCFWGQGARSVNTNSKYKIQNTKRTVNRKLSTVNCHLPTIASSPRQLKKNRILFGFFTKTYYICSTFVAEEYQ
jgi:hypothetical protein